jgi:ribosomal protein L34
MFNNRRTPLTATLQQPRARSIDDERADIASLESQLASIDREIEQAEAAIGSNYRKLAGGAKIPAADETGLQTLIVRRRGMHAALTAARDALAVAERRQKARSVLATAAAARAFLVERDALGAKAEALLDQVVGVLHELEANGRDLMQAMRRERGRDTLTPAGYIASEVLDMAAPQHLQRLAEIHLTRKLGWWHYELMPIFGALNFGPSLAAASNILRSEFDLLTGIDMLDPSDIAAINAEQGA